eukprot:TRINITY_DN26326_c0_g1_i1.p1 TRINITY_DN26326_c0_g1~~TRINITY_DN26326_c0_g1_i1.p1  ORF type:complete len:284 (-),score=51.64 TRINITY_DN26326_c0_g1_i1:694-1545(-)
MATIVAGLPFVTKIAQNVQVHSNTVEDAKAMRFGSFLGRALPSTAPLASSSDRRGVSRSIVRAVATVSAPPGPGTKYQLPTWAEFEMGKGAVFWETATGEEPASGAGVTIWFNPGATQLTPNADFGIGFNGGFNSPIMCAGEPRMMTRKERGPNCVDFFTIRINVPVHATCVEFSFTDGRAWDGPYVLDLEVPAKFKNQSKEFFMEGLTKELQVDGACENAIYPEAPFVQDRCLMPGGVIHEAGLACNLDINLGCTDPESPFFDPLATHDDGSCPIDVPPPSA